MKIAAADFGKCHVSIGGIAVMFDSIPKNVNSSVRGAPVYENGDFLGWIKDLVRSAEGKLEKVVIVQSPYASSLRLSH